MGIFKFQTNKDATGKKKYFHLGKEKGREIPLMAHTCGRAGLTLTEICGRIINNNIYKRQYNTDTGIVAAAVIFI